MFTFADRKSYRFKQQEIMPLRIPDKLPAIDILKKENIFVMDDTRAMTQDIRPLKIVILNLMPLKITTETDLIRLLSNTPLQIGIDFMKLKSHTPKNTPIEHMMMFYRDFEEMKDEKFDGMIVTGAPIELYNYEDVTYWDEITQIFSWARTHVTSTLYICWAAQAGLYYHYGVPKYTLDKKMFGVFSQKTLQPHLPIYRGFDDFFFYAAIATHGGAQGRHSCQQRPTAHCRKRRERRGNGHGAKRT